MKNTDNTNEMNGIPTTQEVGTGLKAEYFGNINLSDLKKTTIDKVVNFDWGTTVPNGLFNNVKYSARWTGKVMSKVSGVITFTTVSDDGVRLWVDGKLIIDDWNVHAPTPNSGNLKLDAGTKYDIKLEYFQKAGGAMVSLSWSAPNLTKEIVPTKQLFPK